MASTYVTELASQIFHSIQNTIKIISEFIGFKKIWEKKFSMILNLTGEEIRKGEKTIITDSEKNLEGVILVQDLIDDCLESITSSDKKLREDFEDNLADFLDCVETNRKPERIEKMRRGLRRSFIKCLGNDRAKYDERLMKQLDLIVQLAEGVGFKARTDFREEFKSQKQNETEEEG